MCKCAITIGIYPNKDYVYNVVDKEDLNDHIEYNKVMRPGRLLYVNGERVHNGLRVKEVLPEYDRLADEIYKKLLKDVNTSIPTRPYR